jgi:hypothetical protein
MIRDDYSFKTSGEFPMPINLVPPVKKILPFPLENIEEDLGNIYFELDKVRKRIEVTKRNNTANLTKARLEKLKKMQFKINTAMSFVRKLVLDLDDFWIN